MLKISERMKIATIENLNSCPPDQFACLVYASSSLDQFTCAVVGRRTAPEPAGGSSQSKLSSMPRSARCTRGLAATYFTYSDSTSRKVGPPSYHGSSRHLSPTTA